MGRQLGAWAGPFPSQFPDGYRGNVWDRQQGESDRAFEAFRHYRDMGPERSMAAIPVKSPRQNPGRRQASGYINGWSVAHSWAMRVDAYDVHMDRERQKARVQAVREEAAASESLRETTLRRVLGVSALMLDRAEEYARFPARKQTVKSRDAKTGVTTSVTFEPLPPAYLKAAALVVREVNALLRQPSVSGASAEARPVGLSVPEPFGEGLEDDPGAVEEQAARELTVWRGKGADEWQRLQEKPPE